LAVRRIGRKHPSTRGIPLKRIVRTAEFRAALRLFQWQSETVSRGWGLTPQRYLLLLSIKGAPDRSQRLSFSQLVERLRLSANTVTELVARAEDAGLVRRERAEHDQRVIFLSLTDEGERRLAGALADSDVHRRELASAFDDLVASFDAAQR